MKEELLIPAVAALVVGLVAGIVSLVVSILAKDQKTSEFRQAWIDGLRNDMSQFVASYGMIVFAGEIVRGRNRSEVEEYVLTQRKDFLELAMLCSRIQLRLNVSKHHELIALLDKATDFSVTSLADADDIIDKAVAATQVILKDEWERVKRGEPSYVRLKLISRVGVISILAASFGSGTVMVIENFDALIRLW